MNQLLFAENRVSGTLHSSPPMIHRRKPARRHARNTHSPGTLGNGVVARSTTKLSCSEFGHVMSKRRNRPGSSSKNAKNRAHSSRRNFLRTAGVAAAALLVRDSPWAQGKSAKDAKAASRDLPFPNINPKFMITSDQASNSAHSLHISQAQLSNYELGQSALLLGALVRLAKKSARTIDWILTGKD